MLANNIILLKRFILRVLRSLIEFIAVLILGLIAAILLVLPWLLRALAVVGWPAHS